MNNITIDNYYKQLLEITNNCGLPVGTAYFVLKDVLNLLKDAYDTALLQENNNNSIEEKTEEFDIDVDKLKEEDPNYEQSINSNVAGYSAGINDREC